MSWYYRTRSKSQVFHQVSRNCGGRPTILEKNFEVFSSAESAARTRRGWRRGCRKCHPNAEVLLRCADCGGTVRVPSTSADRHTCSCGGRLGVLAWLG